MKIRYGAAFALLILAGLSCGQQETKSDATQAADSAAIAEAAAAFPAFDTLPPDSPGEFERKRQLLLATIPAQRQRIEFALKDVSRIVLFEELGLGDQMEVVAPTELTEGWPSGIAINRCFGGEITMLALRFVLDTLPEPRLPGIASLYLLGPQCVDQYGPDVMFSGLQSGQGAVTLFFQHRMPYIETDCCEMGPQMALNGYGWFGDTLMALYIFKPERKEYAIQLLGPRSARGFPRYGYVRFRTERGGLHPELNEYPYLCSRADSGSVDLAIGVTRRQRLDQLEPRLRVTIF